MCDGSGKKNKSLVRDKGNEGVVIGSNITSVYNLQLFIGEIFLMSHPLTSFFDLAES